jgi:hypothetical protein
MTHLQRANDAAPSQLLKATIEVIDELIAAPPAGMHRSNYCGDTSDTITGYVGVQAFLYREGERINLQVNGPETLLRSIVEHYRTNPDLGAPYDFGPGRRIFVVNY